jgi:hypothetical protein
MYVAKRWMLSGKKCAASRRRVVCSQNSKDLHVTICKGIDVRYEHFRPHKEQKLIIMDLCDVEVC